MKKAGLILIFFIGFGCIADAQTVIIGSQIWMTKNLDVSYFRNGEPIPQAKTSDEWKKAGENGKPAWCYYNNDSANGSKFGKLYNWYAVNDRRGLAPQGWHVPGDTEWAELTNYLGGDTLAGGKMKDPAGWNAPNTGASNSSGFSGLPGGDRLSYGSLYNIGYLGFWWSSTESNTDSSAWVRILNYNDDWVYRDFCSKGRGLSVRCVIEPSITIGSQVWMTQNLDVSYFSNGDTIPHAKTSVEWIKAGENEQPAWCYYDNDSANGAKYGKLYNWYAVNDARGLAPEGWHVPSDADWSQLIDYLGGDGVAGGKMKTTTGWNTPNTGATNNSGFSGLPGGLRFSSGPFFRVNERGFWWSSTVNNTFKAWLRILSYDNDTAVRYYNNKTIGFSVRCVKNIIPTIKIGSQVWMRENLNVDTFRNGDTIPHAKTFDEWNKAGENEQPAWCYYNNDSANGAKYGKMYNWYAVNDTRGLAPVGWHVPSDEEWTQLTVYLGGEVGGKMKSTTGWRAPNEGATNSSGFSGLPGGDLVVTGGRWTFVNIDLYGFWWSSSEVKIAKPHAWFRKLYYDRTDILRSRCNKKIGYSVRCVKD